MKYLYYLLTLLLSCFILLSCEKEKEKPEKKSPVETGIDKKAVEGISNEIIEYWKGDPITEEHYSKIIEDHDSVWHVYYVYRLPQNEISEKRPIPHFLIPKQEGKTIRFFITD